MKNLVKAASVSAISEGAGICVELEGRKIAIFRSNGKFHAIDDFCKHRGGPLSEGHVDGNSVACPWHGFVFDITTGNCATNPALKQSSYPVQVQGDSVLIELPPETQ